MVVVSTWVLFSDGAHGFTKLQPFFADPARQANWLSLQQSGFT